MTDIIKRIEVYRDCYEETGSYKRTEEHDQIVFAVLTAVLKMYRGELDSYSVEKNDGGKEIDVYTTNAIVSDLIQEIERQLDE